MKISVIFPTRNNVDDLITSVNSLIATISDKSKLEIFIAVDEDDHSYHHFNEFKDKYFTGVNIRIIIYKRYGYSYLNKYINNLAEESTGDWLLFWNDASTMITKNWDLLVEKYDNSEYFVIATNSNLDEEDGIDYVCIHPIISKKMFNLLGHCSMCRQNDTYVSKLGLKLNKLVFEKNIYIFQKRYNKTPQLYTDIDNYNIILQKDVENINNLPTKKNKIYDVIHNLNDMNLFHIRLLSYSDYVEKFIIIQNKYNKWYTQNLNDERIILADSLDESKFEDNAVFCICDNTDFPNYKKLSNCDITNNLLELDICSEYLNKKTNDTTNILIFKKNNHSVVSSIYNGGVSLVKENLDGLFVDNDIYLNFLNKKSASKYVNDYINDIKIFCDKERAYITLNKAGDYKMLIKSNDIVYYEINQGYVKGLECWVYPGFIYIHDNITLEIYDESGKMIFKKRLEMWLG